MKRLWVALDAPFRNIWDCLRSVWCRSSKNVLVYDFWCLFSFRRLHVTFCALFFDTKTGKLTGNDSFRLVSYKRSTLVLWQKITGFQMESRSHEVLMWQCVVNSQLKKRQSDKSSLESISSTRWDTHTHIQLNHVCSAAFEKERDSRDQCMSCHQVHVLKGHASNWPVPLALIDCQVNFFVTVWELETVSFTKFRPTEIWILTGHVSCVWRRIFAKHHGKAVNPGITVFNHWGLSGTIPHTYIWMSLRINITRKGRLLFIQKNLLLIEQAATELQHVPLATVWCTKHKKAFMI